MSYGYRNEQAQKYKYNGKEYDDHFGLNVYEMDLRQYDPAMGRWVVQDPVIHHDYSPYSAFDNNPVYWSDPSGADSQLYKDKNGNVVAGSFDGQDAQNLFNQYVNSSSKKSEEEVQKMYEFTTSEENNGNGGGGDGKNKNANSRGVGRNYAHIGILGMSSYTFFGAPVRLIPYDFGASSYFGGALNVYVGTWNEYLEKGLDSYIGRHLMHEYGHYLQEKYAGSIDYYNKVVPASLESFQGGNHDRNWTEIQASTLAWIYFNKPKDFDRENIIQYNSISPYAPASIPYKVINLINNQYINHPDYKP
ncbi:RHS repeat-associated core domain-containing protein [Myroides ceti]|uniref:RHS repeat-associated core domain-containing protein n=1 Tax=Paenimyroides ceti TaxID=395087 RepID=A0ABT8CNQ9_9FLAO|nr:RHS repeat-associated core domain-containing protein [Paenimyroides ceti]MDN3706157.1 RHS repeat-associated core domain-containing protein [Paenimyroides ceti]